MLLIFLRTVFVYLFLIVVMRLMGKRQIGELQLSELVTALLLSELASDPILDGNKPLANAIVPILTLICLEIINTFIVTKSDLLRRFLDGAPSIVIERGKLDRGELLKVRMSLEELIAEIRLAGYPDIDDIEYAILEQNGRLSVFPKASKRPPSCEDMQLAPQETGIAHTLVLDGCISAFGLSHSGKTEAWVLRRIRKNGSTLKDTFYFGIDDSGKELFIGK